MHRRTFPIAISPELSTIAHSRGGHTFKLIKMHFFSCAPQLTNDTVEGFKTLWKKKKNP